MILGLIFFTSETFVFLTSTFLDIFFEVVFSLPYCFIQSLYAFVLLSFGISGISLESKLFSPYLFTQSLYALVLLSLGISGIMFFTRFLESDEDFFDILFESFIKFYLKLFIY